MLPNNTIARKLLMSFTAWLMMLFVILHVLGNSTIYGGGLNAYAAALHAFPPLLWMVRLVMLAALVLHVLFGITLTFENSRAKPQPYVIKQSRVATFAGRNMIWTGSIIGAFLAYHLLHFTFQVIDPASAARHNADALGRPDVMLMVMRAFGSLGIAALYVASVAALLLHLMHGIQSSFQTWGVNSDRSFPFIRTGGTVAAVLLFLAYAALPVMIVAGLLK